jgi:hypothetical protein
VAVKAYLGGSVPVQNLFLELHFWRYAASVTLKSGIEGARKQDLGRKHDSASAECQPPRLGEAWRSKPRRIVGGWHIRLVVRQTLGWLVFSPRENGS